MKFFHIPIKKLLLHLMVFVIVELLFVVLLFHELPHISLFETIGIIHLAYWLILIFAGIRRERVRSVRKKFLCSYGPVVFHLAGHLYISRATIDHHAHHHNLLRIISGTIGIGILFRGAEWLLHRVMHCQHHHTTFHVHHCQKNSSGEKDA